MAKFAFKSARWDTVAPGEDPNINSGDPRRDDSMDFLRMAVKDALAPNNLPDLYPCIVVNVRACNSLHFIRKSALLKQGSYVSETVGTTDSSGKAIDGVGTFYIYKVVNLMLNPEPFPRSPTDPILYTYPDIDVSDNLVGGGSIPLGTFVKVRYDDPANLKGGTIISAPNPGSPGIDWDDKSSTLKSLWANSDLGPPKMLPKNPGTVKAPKGYGYGDATWYPSYNWYSLQGTRRIRNVMVHTTEGARGSALSVLAQPGSEKGVSAHYVVDSDGTIYHLVADNDVAQHAGGTANKRSIGIEIVGKAKFQDTWNQKNKKALAALFAFLSKTYNIPLTYQAPDWSYVSPEINGKKKWLNPDAAQTVDQAFTKGFVAHGAIAGSRRYDPGYYFPWTEIMTAAKILIAHDNVNAGNGIPQGPSQVADISTQAPGEEGPGAHESQEEGGTPYEGGGSQEDAYSALPPADDYPYG